MMHKNEMACNEDTLQAKLKIDCEKCIGLCCVALYCMKTDGFPANKQAGIPCKHLKPDFRCEIHTKLVSKKMQGCLAYDCFGAGQKVTQNCYPNITWQSDPDKADEIFQVFLTIFALHQMEWYLLQALPLAPEEHLQAEIKALIAKNEQLTNQSPDKILNVDVETYRRQVNQTLKKVIAKFCTSDGKRKDYVGKDFKKANLDGRDFSMTLMMAANLEGCSLRGATFLGTDMRDVNIQNTDLRECIFLTQMQLNATKGNANTKISANLSRPISW